ncbi:unnamed protein product, partial [Ceratitis capitata]
IDTCNESVTAATSVGLKKANPKRRRWPSLVPLCHNECAMAMKYFEVYHLNEINMQPSG